MGSSSFAEVSLGDIVDFRNGKAIPPEKYTPDGKHPVFGSNGQIACSDEVLCPDPTIVIGRVGAYCGCVHYVPRASWVTDNAIVALPQEGNDIRYLYYLLGSLELERTAIGSAQPLMTQKGLKVIQTKVPPLPEQKAIAQILGTLDDKIELNRRMNGTLEEMAQELFKSWFVDYDPVIDNALSAGNPIPDELAPRAEIRRQALADGTANRQAAKPFPAAFQETESMGWIPEGWELKAFDTLAKLDTTSVKPFEQPETVWEHYSIPSYDSTGMPSWDRGNEIKSNKYLVKPGAILSSKLNPETERTWWPFMMDDKTSICSTEFMQFVPHKKEEQAFVYSLIRSDPFQANILERVTGSTGSRQRAQPKQIAEIEVIDCGELLRAEFIKIALPLFQSIRNNSLRVPTLAKLCDTLLPKLISGELRIPEAKQLTKEALA